MTNAEIIEDMEQAYESYAAARKQTWAAYEAAVSSASTQLPAAAAESIRQAWVAYEAAIRPTWHVYEAAMKQARAAYAAAEGKEGE